MSKTPEDHARLLWGKARNDLIAARATIATGFAFDTVCFHAQQAVEKSLKAILALRDEVYPKTHELTTLVKLAKAAVAPWPFDDDLIQELTPFAVLVRYDNPIEPTRADAERAIGTAEMVHLRVGTWIDSHSPGTPGETAGG